ncbi:MAG: FtsQ-type POTRA domain-containing protein [Candidatus Gracilibacteria bacterium]|nr:FtsQ-type POTRA domain-containing protein [Candidatus Gracilibacteria bacterium]
MQKMFKDDDTYVLAGGSKRNPFLKFLRKFKRNKLPFKRSDLYAEKKISKSFNFAARERKVRGKKLIVILMLILLGIMTAVLSYYAFFSGAFTLQEILVINDSRNKTLDDETIYNQLVNFKGENLIQISSSEIASMVMNKNVRIQSVEVDKVYPQTIKILFTEYAIVALFKDLVAGTEQLVNEAGVIVPTVPIEGRDKLIKIEVSSDVAKKVGELAIPREDLKFINDLQFKLLDVFAGLEIDKVRYLPILKEVRVATKPGFEIWFDLERDLETSIEDLFLAFDQGNFSGTYFSYVDLRIPGKVFVCTQENC